MTRVIQRDRDYPSARALTSALRVMLNDDHPASGVTVLDRQPAVEASTFPSEVVKCQLSDGRELELFCKYALRRHAPEPAWHTAHGHRGGLAYEADVYERVLEPLGMPAVQLRGVYRSGRQRLAGLFLDYLGEATRVHRDPGALAQAAGWIGEFHRLNTDRVGSAPLAFLRRYDADYYRGWATRTRVCAGRYRPGCRWIAEACERFERDSATLASAAQTVIHGEYYPSNVLLWKREVHPVDWETAAVAAGEIDLAALIDGWPVNVAKRCERAYVKGRWPEGAPPEFAATLRAARAYWLFRWTGARRAWTTVESRSFYVERLRREASHQAARVARPTPEPSNSKPAA